MSLPTQEGARWQAGRNQLILLSWCDNDLTSLTAPSVRLSVRLSYTGVKQKMENPVKTLRLAIGKTQQDFAQILGCGYSTLQGYEAGRAIPPAIREKLVSLALERRLGDLAADLKQNGKQDEAEELDSLRQEAHLVIDAVFSSGDPSLIEALRAVIRLCDKITSRRSR